MPSTKLGSGVVMVIQAMEDEEDGYNGGTVGIIILLFKKVDLGLWVFDFGLMGMMGIRFNELGWVVLWTGLDGVGPVVCILVKGPDLLGLGLYGCSNKLQGPNL